MGKFLPATALAVCCTAALFAMTLLAPVSPGSPVAILFPPRTNLVEAFAAVAAAGGLVERTGRWENIVVASFPGRQPPVDILESAGAWLVFNAVVAGGCDPAAPQPGIQATRTDRTASDEGLNS